MLAGNFLLCIYAGKLLKTSKKSYRNKCDGVLFCKNSRLQVCVFSKNSLLHRYFIIEQAKFSENVCYKIPACCLHIIRKSVIYCIDPVSDVVQTSYRRLNDVMCLLRTPVSGISALIGSMCGDTHLDPRKFPRDISLKDHPFGIYARQFYETFCIRITPYLIFATS